MKKSTKYIDRPRPIIVDYWDNSYGKLQIDAYYPDTLETTPASVTLEMEKLIIDELIHTDSEVHHVTFEDWSNPRWEDGV